MQVQEAKLNPLSGIELKADEIVMLKWLRSVSWQQVAGPHGAVAFKAKIPEFYGGVRLYNMQAGAGGALGALELFIKRLGLQGVIGKQTLYPIEGHGTQPRYLSLKKADMENLGVGKAEEDED